MFNAFCRNCHAVCQMNEEAFTKLQTMKKVPQGLLALNEIHLCCGDPDHSWLIGTTVDVSLAVIDYALKEE